MPLKHALCCLLLACCSVAAHGQLGFQIGYNSASLKLSGSIAAEAPSRIGGISFGVLYRTQGRLVCVQPTLTYIQKGASSSELSISTLRKYEYLYTRLNYLEFSLPVLFRIPVYKNEWSLEAGAGPYGALLRRAKAKGKEFIAGGKVFDNYAIGNTSNDHFKKWDAGLALAVSITCQHVALGVSYDLGLSNITPRPDRTIKNRNLNISLMFLL